MRGKVTFIHFLSFMCKKTLLDKNTNTTFYEKDLLKNIVGLFNGASNLI